MDKCIFVVLLLVLAVVTADYVANAEKSTKLACKGAHEAPSCLHCQLTCATLGKPCNYKKKDACVKGCYCELGYARDSSGHCIESSKCPPREEEEELVFIDPINWSATYSNHHLHVTV